MSNIEEIKKLKALLDRGAINEEEFQRIKKNLLLVNRETLLNNPVSEVKNSSNSKRRKGLITFIVTLIIFSCMVIIGGFLNKKDIIRLNLNVLSHQKDNINSNSIDTLRMYDNTIYESGVAVGNLIVVEFVTKYNKYGRVFNVAENKMWTPLFYEYEDLGDNYYITIPKILTEQNKYTRIGRDYYNMNIYDDQATNTWWEKESGFYLPKKEDFKSIKLSIRNRKAISGRNAIFINGHEKDVHYTFYFFEESLR